MHSSARAIAMPAHSVPWIQPKTSTRLPCESPARKATIGRPSCDRPSSNEPAPRAAAAASKPPGEPSFHEHEPPTMTTTNTLTRALAIEVTTVAEDAHVRQDPTERERDERAYQSQPKRAPSSTPTGCPRSSTPSRRTDTESSRRRTTERALGVSPSVGSTIRSPPGNLVLAVIVRGELGWRKPDFQVFSR